MRPALPMKPLPRTRLLRVFATLAYAPHVALIGLHAGAELATLARALKSAWRKARGEKVLTVFAWTAMTEAMKARYIRATHRLPSPRFADMCRLSIASDGTRARWVKAVEALVLEGAPRFSLVVHAGGGRADEVLADVETLMPLCDDATLLAVLGVSHKQQALAIRTLMQRRFWHCVVLGDIAILARPPVAIPVEETADEDHEFAAQDV